MKTLLNVLKNPLLSLVIIYLALVFLGVSFGDKGWYEADGVAILAGSANLEAGRQGDFFLYRYYYQPLTYQLNHLVFLISGQAYLLYLLPALLGAAGVCFLAFAVHLFSKRRINIFFSFCLLLFFPEIFYRLLYPNSSVFGMLFFSLCLLFLFLKQSNNWLYFLIGIISSLACIFRFDFVLGIPILLCLVAIRSRSSKALAFFLVGIALIFLPASVCGLFRPYQILSQYKFHLLFGQSFNWKGFYSLAVLFSLTNILIWIFLAGYGFIYLKNAAIKKKWRSLGILIAVLFLFYPVLGKFTSAHYMMAAVCLGPFLLVKAMFDFSNSNLARHLTLNFSRLTYLIVGYSLLVQLLSFEIQPRFPYLKITKDPSQVNTLDGPRVLGAYFKGYREVFKSNNTPYWRNALSLSQGLTRLVASSKSDFVIVGLNRRIPENYLLAVTTYCLPFFLQVQGYKLKLKPGAMILKGRQNKVFIQDLNLKQYQNFKAKDVPDHIRAIKIPLVYRASADLNQDLRQFWLEIVKKIKPKK